VQLNQSGQDLSARGVTVAAITPDAPRALAAFAQRHHITYPLLSDADGRVIRLFGLLNPNIPKDHPRQSRWLPFPGIMLIGPDRSIRRKHFTGDLRRRAAGQNVLFDIGDDRGPVAGTGTAHVTVDIRSATTRVYPGQDVALRVRVSVDDGWHVYAPGAAPYTGLGLSLTAPPRFALTDVRIPDGEVLELVGLGESVPVLSGAFDIEAVLQVPWSPPPSMFAEIAPAVERRHLPVGHHDVELEIALQTCSHDECEPPTRLTASVPVEVQPHAAAADAPQSDDV
jgi:hypothetical protein